MTFLRPLPMVDSITASRDISTGWSIDWFPSITWYGLRRKWSDAATDAHAVDARYLVHAFLAEESRRVVGRRLNLVRNAIVYQLQLPGEEQRGLLLPGSHVRPGLQRVLLAAVHPLHNACADAFKSRNDVPIGLTHDDFHIVFLSALSVALFNWCCLQAGFSAHGDHTLSH